jgi:hypothetical protein
MTQVDRKTFPIGVCNQNSKFKIQKVDVTPQHVVTHFAHHKTLSLFQPTLCAG